MSSTDDVGRIDEPYNEVSVDAVGAEDATDGRSSEGSRQAD